MNIELDVSEESFNEIVVKVMEHWIHWIIDIPDETLPSKDFQKYMKAFIDVHEFFTTHDEHNTFMKSVE